MKKLKNILMAVAMSMVLFAPLAAPVHALDLMPNQDFGDTLGIDSDASLTEIIAKLISIVLGFLGIIVVLIILYAGFMWMTAGGDTEKVGKAKSWMINGVIGLVIIAAAWAIANFVTGSIGSAVSGGSGYTY